MSVASWDRQGLIELVPGLKALKQKQKDLQEVEAAGPPQEVVIYNLVPRTSDSC